MNQNEVENEIKHWGILGMHWGIRRYQNPDGSLTPEGRERYLKKTEQIIKDENAHPKVTNKVISKFEDAFDDLNKEFEKKGWVDDNFAPHAKEYNERAGEVWNKLFKEIANERYDAYGLSQHAINMITEDLVDEHIFDMPDFSFTNRLGMEDIDFEAMRKFMQEKFGEVLDPTMIDGFVNSYSIKSYNTYMEDGEIKC